jgi:hypothetical protein
MRAPKKANARRQPGERVSNLTNKRKLRTSLRDVKKSYGPPELCAWQVDLSVFWIQTTDPQFSRKLEKRKDTRRVEVSGINHSRRTFELRGTWRKIRRIIDRYLVSAGDHIFTDFGPATASEIPPSISTAGDKIEGQNGQK